MNICKLIDMFQCNRENTVYYLLFPSLFGKGAFGPLALNPWRFVSTASLSYDVVGNRTPWQWSEIGTT